MTITAANFESRKSAVFERVKNLLGRACVFPIGDSQALDEMEQACNAAESAADPDEQKKIISDAISSSQTASFIRRFSALNGKLMPFGRWVSPTYMVHHEVAEIEALTDRVVALNVAGDTAGVQSAMNEIVRKMAMAAFDPTVRAFMNVRAVRLPHLADVAHYLETATLSFYRQDYFTVANTLIPAIERLLVSMIGFRLGHAGEIHTRDYRAYLQTTPAAITDPALIVRFEAHRDELIRFLFDRFFKRSPEALSDGTYDASYVNRAFPLHLNEPGSYYTFGDCITYFQVFDLFTEYLAARYGLQLPGLIPDQDPEVAKRVNEYWGVILSDWLRGGNSVERRLLQISPYYIPETDCNYLALHDGFELNRLLFRALPSLDIAMLADHNVHKERREKLEWLIGHLSGTGGSESSTT